MDNEYHHLDKVWPGLWVGDLHSARDADTLKANNIQSILTVMRGKFSIPQVRIYQVSRLLIDSQCSRGQTFIRNQIPLDDVEEADILQHLIPAITFIQGELDKDRSVLVHCQAGTSGFLRI